jgi:hypothetical protein
VGLNLHWQDDVETSIKALGFSLHNLYYKDLNLLSIQNTKLIINLLSCNTSIKAIEVLHFQDCMRLENKHLINLWEDVWLTRKNQVVHRLKSLLGLNIKIFGRKTVLQNLSQIEADQFLNFNHLQGSAKAKYRFGLTYKDNVVAVASFSGTRDMHRQGPDYISAELIRFASKDGCTVVGGMTKLIKHFSLITKPNDIMSYADRDWSLGSGYQSSGFILDKTIDPQDIYLNVNTLRRFFFHRLPIEIRRDIINLNQHDLESHLIKHGFKKIFNIGNLKYKLFY